MGWLGENRIAGLAAMLHGPNLAGAAIANCVMQTGNSSADIVSTLPPVCLNLS